MRGENVTGSATIRAVKVATLQAPLPVPVVFGNWVMRHREFAICGVIAADGTVGVSYCYTRDGPIQALVERLIAPQYAGKDPTRPEELVDAAAWSNNAVLASGIGHRAVSLVDVATWDLAAKLGGQTIEKMLGGEARPHPVTAIVGYPPTMPLDELKKQVGGLIDGGWRRFKLPIAPTHEATRERLSAVRAFGEELWLGLDTNWVFKNPADAIEFIKSLEPIGLGWVEDLMPPGRAQDIAAIRRAVGVPIAMGDEQGGAYHPETLMLCDAVDIFRVDASTNGGITGLRRVIAALGERRYAPHMFPHVHSRLFSALGIEGAPIEWGIVGNGVDQVTDRFTRPVVTDGLMAPLPPDLGFGMAVDPEWLRAQGPDDPDNLIGDL